MLLPESMKAAVIGLGRIGFEFGLEKGRGQTSSHVACYQAIEEISDLALCDIDENKLQVAAQHVKEPRKFYLDYKKMLDEFKPEVVSICTPTPIHCETVLNVAEYDSVKAIFLEKPIAQSLSEADDIINACNKAHIKLTVDHVRRWDPMYLKLMSEINECPYTVVGLHPGPLIRTGIHMLDLFNWIIPGQPETVQAFGTAKTNYLDNIVEKDGWIDYNVNGCINYPETEAVLYSGRSAKDLILFELDLLTESSRIKITENGDRMQIFRVHPSHRYGSLEEFYASETLHKLYQCEDPLLNAVKEVCFATINSCSGEAARSALNIALALHWSAMHKGSVVKPRDVPKDFTVRSY